MLVNTKEFEVRNLHYKVRSAQSEDAQALSELRLQIDGETENLDRVKGKEYIDGEGFKDIIKSDSESLNSIFLVAEVNGTLVGFSRCEGNELKRSSHKLEFGVGVLKDYWGYGIGKNFLKESVKWADANNIKKITLNVLETNEKAIILYKNYGFQIEGVLQKELLADGNYYNTLLMGRLN
ncbi:Protein N-acetyltransferase, RimJ/RimL family [Halobacillus dabanensis]|uniref:Protein N-acetyltransferase, RimJ/RimL family n=1 Tax=Halobacillus dabanensis TaxID=240302 RepID=A0A1I3YK28_HALDA|nr:GNAT family N-acetyltransferase [Halobacillus dabanensis]SFK31631.1 Protein N-acetyltransferase, RimJ/RimL family [Halobacillus dabanensis]